MLKRYKTTKEKDGTMRIHNVPIFAPIEREMEFGDGGKETFTYDEKWIKTAVNEAKRRQDQNGNIPTLYVEHKDQESGETRREIAGFFENQRVQKMQFDGERKPVVFADLLITDPILFAEIQKHQFPGVSVEIRPSQENQPETFTAAALLNEKPAALKFPPLAVLPPVIQFMEAQRYKKGLQVMCFSEFPETTGDQDFVIDQDVARFKPKGKKGLTEEQKQARKEKKRLKVEAEKAWKILGLLLADATHTVKNIEQFRRSPQNKPRDLTRRAVEALSFHKGTIKDHFAKLSDEKKREWGDRVKKILSFNVPSIAELEKLSGSTFSEESLEIQTTPPDRLEELNLQSATLSRGFVELLNRMGIIIVEISKSVQENQPVENRFRLEKDREDIENQICAMSVKMREVEQEKQALIIGRGDFEDFGIFGKKVKLTIQDLKTKFLAGLKKITEKFTGSLIKPSEITPEIVSIMRILKKDGFDTEDIQREKDESLKSALWQRFVKEKPQLVGFKFEEVNMKKFKTPEDLPEKTQNKLFEEEDQDFKLSRTGSPEDMKKTKAIIERLEGEIATTGGDAADKQKLAYLKKQLPGEFEEGADMLEEELPEKEEGFAEEEPDLNSRFEALPEDKQKQVMDYMASMEEAPEEEPGEEMAEEPEEDKPEEDMGEEEEEQDFASAIKTFQDEYQALGKLWRKAANEFGFSSPEAEAALKKMDALESQIKVTPGQSGFKIADAKKAAQFKEEDDDKDKSLDNSPVAFSEKDLRNMAVVFSEQTRQNKTLRKRIEKLELGREIDAQLENTQHRKEITKDVLMAFEEKGLGTAKAVLKTASKIAIKAPGRLPGDLSVPASEHPASVMKFAEDEKKFASAISFAESFRNSSHKNKMTLDRYVNNGMRSKFDDLRGEDN